MAIRLLASDLDGTLFGPDHVPEARTVASINAAADAGLIIAAVTGRSMFDGVDRVVNAGAHLDWFIGSNGGHRIEAATRELQERLEFDAAAIESTVAAVGAAHPELAFGFEHAEGFRFTDAFIEYYPVSLGGGPRRSGVQETRFNDIGKVFVAHPALITTDLVALVEPFVAPGMNVTTSGIDFIEITPAGADKGSALARLCSLLGVDRTEVIAFGDNYNDLTMIEWAGRGVAMGNAADAVKAIADDVTLTNDQFGVATVIDALLAEL